MFCKYCGAQLKDGAKFCNNCGKPVPVRRPETAAAAPVTPAAPAPQTAPVPPVNPAPPAAPAPHAAPVPPVNPAPQAAPVPPVFTAPNPAPQQAPNYRGPVNPVPPVRPANPAPARTAEPEYQGRSRMESLRFVSGLMFIIMGLADVLTSIFNNGFNSIVYGLPGRSFLSSLGTTLIVYALFSLVPGIASLVLKKPTRTRNIILTIILGVCLLLLAGSKLAVPRGTYMDLAGRISGYFNTGGLFFCTLMALISIFMPKNLVGEPAPTAAKPWKIIAGILNLINAIVFILAGLFALAGMIVFLVERRGMDMSMIPVFRLLFPCLTLGIWMLVGAILSIGCAHGKHKPLSSAFLDLRCMVISCASLMSVVSNILVYRTTMYSGADIGAILQNVPEDVAIAMVIGLVLFGLMALWYFVCTVISMITAFNKKRAA